MAEELPHGPGSTNLVDYARDHDKEAQLMTVQYKFLRSFIAKIEMATNLELPLSRHRQESREGSCKAVGAAYGLPGQTKPDQDIFFKIRWREIMTNSGMVGEAYRL